MTYKIQKTPEWSCITIHVDHLRPYEEVVPPLRWVPEVIPQEKSIPVDTESIEDGQVLSHFNVEASPNLFQDGEGK